MTNPQTAKRRPRRPTPGPVGLPHDLDLDRSREEITLAEFPVTTMAQRRPKMTELAVEEFIGYDENKLPIHRAWTVVGSDRYGLPLAGDEDIYVSIVKMLEHRDFTERVVACTRYQICQLLEVKPDGRVYQRISDALTRLANTKFVAENLFRDPETGALVKREAFGMIDAFRFVDRAPRRSSSQLQQELPLSYIRVADEFLRRLRCGKLKRLDIEFWRSLTTPLAKRLFRFLDKNRYRKEEYEIGVVKLGLRLGLASSHPAKEVKRLLKRPIEELKQRGFLSDYRFEVGRGVASKIRFRFNPEYAPNGRRRSQVVSEPTNAPERLSESRTAPNSTPSEVPSPPEDLARRFYHGRYGVEQGSPTPAQVKKAQVLLTAAGGDVRLAEIAVDYGAQLGREAGPDGFPNHIAGVLEGPFLDIARQRQRDEDDAEARQAEQERTQKLHDAYEQAMEQRAARRLAALSDEDKERIIDERLPKMLDEFRWYIDRQGWNPARAREWAAPRLVRDYGKEGAPPFPKWIESHDPTN